MATKKVSVPEGEFKNLSAGPHEVTFMFEGEDRVTLPVELAEGEFKKVSP